MIADQNPQHILASLRQHLKDQGYANVEVGELEGSTKPAQNPVDTPLMKAVVDSAHLIYGVEPHILPRMASTGPMEALCQRYGLSAIGGAGVGYAGSRTRPTKTSTSPPSPTSLTKVSSTPRQ